MTLRLLAAAVALAWVVGRLSLCPAWRSFAYDPGGPSRAGHTTPPVVGHDTGLDPGRHGARGEPATPSSGHETAAGVLSSLDAALAQAARIERRQGFMLEARAACEDRDLGCEWGARSWTVLPGPIARCECVVPSLARGRR